MNILLNTPMPSTTSSKIEYENKILYYFLIMMAILVLTVILFVELVKPNLPKTPISTQDSPPSVHLYV